MVSIIVPIYHAQTTLCRCVDSLLRQTVSDWELLLVFDGGSQAEWEQGQAYAKKDARIRLFRQTHAGLSAARNCGLDAARGSFIGFVDADDEVTPDFLARLLPLLSRGEKISMCGVQCDLAGGDVVEQCLSADEVLTRLAAQDGWGYVIACNKLFARELFDGERFPVGKIHEDEFLLPRLIVKAGGAACTARRCYLYHYHAQGTARTRDEAYLDYLEALHLQLRLFRARGLQIACERVIEKELYAFLKAKNTASAQKAAYANKLTARHTAFCAEMRGVSLPWSLRVKRRAAAVCPRLYYRADHALLCVRQAVKERKKQ